MSGADSRRVAPSYAASTMSLVIRPENSVVPASSRAMRPGRSRSTSWPRPPQMRRLAEHDAVRPHPQQPAGTGGRVGRVERDGADGQHRAVRQLGGHVEVGGRLETTVDEAGTVDAYRRVQPGDRTRRLQRSAQCRPWGSVARMRFEHDPPAGVEIRRHRAHPAVRPVVGVEGGRPVLRSRRATAAPRGNAVGAPPVARATSTRTGLSARVSTQAEPTARRPSSGHDRHALVVSSGPPSAIHARRSVARSVHTLAAISSSGTPSCRSAATVAPADVPIVAAAAPTSRPASLTRHEDAGTDPDRHGAAATDDDGEARFVVRCVGHRLARVPRRGVRRSHRPGSPRRTPDRASRRGPP